MGEIKAQFVFLTIARSVPRRSRPDTIINIAFFEQFSAYEYQFSAHSCFQARDVR